MTRSSGKTATDIVRSIATLVTVSQQRQQRQARTSHVAPRLRSFAEHDKSSDVGAIAGGCQRDVSKAAVRKPTSSLTAICSYLTLLRVRFASSQLANGACKAGL